MSFLNRCYRRIALFTLGCLCLIAPLSIKAQNPSPLQVTAGDGTKLRYVVEGSGVPCIVVNGIHYRPVFSKDLRRHLKLVFVDFRNSSEAEAATKLDDITLDTLLDDIDQVRKALGVDRVAVMGHSLPSLIALEYARKYPEHTSHVILIGAPPFMIPPKESEAFWESDASEARKLANKRNLERISDEDLKKATLRNMWKLMFVRNGARYWYDASYDSSWMLEGIAPNMKFIPHVFSLFTGYDVRNRTPRVTRPVFLAVGRYDYLVPYHTWDGRKDSFPNSAYHLFEKSGHYPMFEEPALFQKKLLEWLRKK
ncbi:MAG TPA: alpha/beta hydrolase [Pyrinomonadaceae bacterium]|nr:alpha/beta hydrolase [Pyrinomonadaceae bacterium]